MTLEPSSLTLAPPDPVPEHIRNRRETVFLVLSGLFLGTLGMLNILGISRFINIFTWGDFAVTVAVGVLPYPLTFLCTDLISELYGKERANQVVWVGLLLNIWVLFIVWLGGILPGFEPSTRQRAKLSAMPPDDCPCSLKFATSPLARSLPPWPPT